MVVAAFSLWLYLLAAMGAAAFFLSIHGAISISRQNRAIALSHYACAPLAFTAIPGIVLFMIWVFREPLDKFHGGIIVAHFLA